MAHSRWVVTIVGSLMCLLLVPRWASAQADTAAQILSPADGAVLTGVVEIRGTVADAAFLSANLAFSYAEEASEHWFEIADIAQSVTDGPLAMWDTTAITDGAYWLRLRLKGSDGTVHDSVIQVQVRNYTTAPTPAATVTPTLLPMLQVETPMVLATATTSERPPVSSPTAQPPNPAGLSQRDVWIGFARGGIAALAAFLLWATVILRRRA